MKELKIAVPPTILLESLLLNLLISIYKGRKFISFNVRGEFLQPKTNDNKLLLLKLKDNKVVNMMFEINPDHMPNVRYEGNVKVLYFKVMRTIYGCIEAALK